MNFHVVIPARFASTRLPAKPLLELGGRAMVLRVVDCALRAGAESVIVATDDSRIFDCVQSAGFEACMTDPAHASGTDRLAEVARAKGWSDDTIVVNLQGDEPLTPRACIREVVLGLADPQAAMSTLYTPVVTAEELFNPNCVKLVADAAGCALYFSRAPIPWARDAFSLDRSQLPEDMRFLRHVGIYAYRAGALARLAALPRSTLEIAESLEQLRALQAGWTIAVREAPETMPAGVDTHEDWLRVDALFRAREGMI